MSVIEVIRAWFRWSVPFAAKRRAVAFLQSLPEDYRYKGRVKFTPGMVNVTWGRPSWSTKTVNVLIDQYGIHFWIFQGDRSGPLRAFKRETTAQRAGAYMGALLQKCEL